MEWQFEYPDNSGLQRRTDVVYGVSHFRSSAEAVNLKAVFDGVWERQWLYPAFFKGHTLRDQLSWSRNRVLSSVVDSKDRTWRKRGGAD